MKRKFSGIHIDSVMTPLFARVIDRFFLCVSGHTPVFTDFYDPAKWTAFVEYLKCQNQNVYISTFGGSENCERRMLGFFPPEDKDASFPIARLRISYNVKFDKSPRHQDYLGSILGLGFDRGKIGDIFLDSDKGYGEVFVSQDISGYICGQLAKVGKVSVKLREVFKEDDLIKQQQEIEERINVASMRLDVVVAAIFRLSRGKVSALIGAEKVFVNWSVHKDKSWQVKPGDMITLRGYGRAKVGEVLGITKKERLKIIIYRF